MPAFSKLSQYSILQSNICDAHPIPFCQTDIIMTDGVETSPENQSQPL
jgi:hypothetical protein